MYVVICPGNFVYHVTAPSPTKYYNINIQRVSYKLILEINWFCLTRESAHCPEESLLKLYKKFMSILSGNLCPILCESTNSGCKRSHLEEIITVLYFTVHIWLLWYQFCIWICLDKSLSPMRVDVNVVICQGYCLHQLTAPSQHSIIILIFNVFLTS